MHHNLVVTRAGSRSLHQTWLDGDPDRNWDLFVLPYEATAESANLTVCRYGDVTPGQKYPGLRKLFADWNGWRDYFYVTLADDDLFVPPDTWSRFFDRVAQYDAKLAQPALTEDSIFGHVVTVRNTEFVARRTTFVEIMTPCFRSDVLAELLPTFDLTQTGIGWGLDHLWAKRLGFTDIWVIDDTPITHWRPGSLSDELGKASHAELLKIAGEPEQKWIKKTLAGVDKKTGFEITEHDPAFLPQLFKGYAQLLDKHPERFHEIYARQSS